MPKRRALHLEDNGIRTEELDGLGEGLADGLRIIYIGDVDHDED
ncbi:MAG: hypothetical protein ABSA46_14205 [Thermodesulfovibrionales bacterium]